MQRRARVLAQAEQELLSAKLVKLLDNLNVQQAAVRKAKHALEEAETKLRNVKRWTPRFRQRDGGARQEPRQLSLACSCTICRRAWLSDARRRRRSKPTARLRAATRRPRATADGEPAELPPAAMSTSGVENLLAQALKNLSAEWQETRDHWRDRKAAGV